MVDKISSGARLANLWDDAKAAALDEPGRLVYRSNILGSDKRVTNYGGGNTSSKIIQKDPLTGQDVEVLWVKGSGGDSASIKLDGFATLYMDKLRALKALYRGVDHEDEMVGYLPHCTFNLNPRAASIDTPLHAYVPRPFVDHMHPDAIIAIAAAQDSRELTKKIFGDEIGWLPWKKPGYELGLWLEKFCVENPEAKGVVLESHGLFTWGDTPKECYTTTIATINKAIDWFEKETAGKPAFGGACVTSVPKDERRAIAAALMPKIRGMISQSGKKVGHFDDSESVLEFVNSRNLAPLAALGTSCPDHFLRTKIAPLTLDPTRLQDDSYLAQQIADYRAMYAAYSATLGPAAHRAGQLVQRKKPLVVGPREPLRRHPTHAGAARNIDLIPAAHIAPRFENLHVHGKISMTGGREPLSRPSSRHGAARHPLTLSFVFSSPL